MFFYRMKRSEHIIDQEPVGYASSANSDEKREIAKRKSFYQKRKFSMKTM